MNCSIWLSVNDLWIRARVQNEFHGVVSSVKRFIRLHKKEDKGLFTKTPMVNTVTAKLYATMSL